jgi:transitional endoplasmic reticulum ATPase
MTISENITMISLTVHKSYNKDAGHGVIRISYDDMEKIGVSTGDFIQVKGKTRITLKCLPIFPSDECKDILRMDKLSRHNADVKVGDKITILKITPSIAKKIFLLPINEIKPYTIDQVLRYIKRQMFGMPLSMGNFVRIPYLDTYFFFQVTHVEPNTNVVINSKTELIGTKDSS